MFDPEIRQFRRFGLSVIELPDVEGGLIVSADNPIDFHNET